MTQPNENMGTRKGLVIHALSAKAYKRHKDAIDNFNKEYIKTEIFPREIGRKIGEKE